MTYRNPTNMWTTSASRRFRAFAYLGLSIASIITMIAPSNIIFGIFGKLPFFVYFWSALLLAGSFACFYGVIKKKWVGEFVGLPGVTTSLLLYGAGCFLDTPSLTIQRVFLGFIVFSMAAFCYARKKEVDFQKRASEYESRVISGKPGV